MMRQRRDRGETLEDVRRRPASLVASLGLVLAVLAALAALVAGPGHRFGLWPLAMSFTLLQASFWSSFAAVIVSAAGLIVARPRGRRRGMLRAFAGLAIGLVVVGVLTSFLRTAMALPPIHDITTDPNDPPQFQTIVPLRVDAPNPIDYPGAEVAAQQEDSYPDVQPLLTERAPEETFARALEAAGDLGWEVVAADGAEGRIEAVDTTFWFGFQDDVVVRIQPANDGSRIDVRSKSRVGVGDLGTNAARIRAYLDALSIRLAEA